MAKVIVDDEENKSSKLITKSTVDDVPLPPKGARTMIWDTEVKASASASRQAAPRPICFDTGWVGGTRLCAT